MVSWMALHLITSAAQQLADRPPASVPHQLPCDLCHDYHWLLVVASGRSGSTAVMDMLNAIPGVLVTGENDGYITKIGAAYKTLTSEPRQFFEKPYSAWWRTTRSYDHLLCDIQWMARSLVGNVDPDEKLNFVGWKEIRYTSVDDLNVITKLFPCAKFVINYRHDVDSQSKSGFYALRAGHTAVVNGLLRQNELYKRWATTLGPQRTFVLPLEEFGVPSFNRLLKWLGYSNCSFNAVIHSNINGSGGIPSRRDIEAVIPDREYCLPPAFTAY